MSRIKILLLILIVAILSIVFVQNREPIALQLLCGDRSQTCLYQTPQLPLAAWMALATLTGAVANLLVQTLNRYGYKDSSRKRPVLDEDLYSNSDRAWENKSSRERYAKADTTSTAQDLDKTFETKQEPQNVEHSGSTYSYKYREAGDRDRKIQDSPKYNSVESNPPQNGNRDSEEEDWI